MTNETLAHFANLTLYSAMAVYTLAMIAYAAYLAGLVPQRSAAREAAASAQLTPDLVGASAGRGSFASGGRAGSVETTQPERTPAPPAGARKLGGVAWTLTLLGTPILLASAVLRGLSVHRWPLGNMFEFAVVGSVFVMVAFCFLGFRRDVRWLGLFVVGPVLLTLGLALTVWYTEAAELMPSLKSVWLAIHVMVATLASALFTIAFSLGVLYLIQLRVEADGRRSFMNRLPASGPLERMAHGLHIVAFPLWTFTLIAGAIWARQAWGSYWNWDPKEVWTFVIWVVYAAYLHARATSGWSRRSATLIALAGFACLILNYAVVNVFFVSQHSYSGL